MTMRPAEGAPAATADRTYSLMRGGLVYTLVARTFGRRVRRVHVWLAVLLAAVAMLPVAVATLANGTFHGGAVDVPLWEDFSTLARFLFVVPLLALSAPGCDRLMRRALSHVPRCGLLSQGNRPAFDRLLDQVRALRDPRWTEALLLAVAFAPLFFVETTFDTMSGIDSWRSVEDAAGRFASGWMDVVALPLFRFIILLWLWRFAMWTYLLWRLSRLHLRFDAGHPDGSAGILFLGESQFRFVVIALAGGILVSANCMNHVIHLGETIEQQKHLMFGYVLLSCGLLMSPVLLLGRRLFRVKQKALLAYSELGHLSASDFGERWLQSGTTKSLLDSGDSSALADYGSVYASVRGMSIFPMTRSTVVWFVLIAASPFLPLFLVAMPLEELFNRLVSVIA